MATFDMEGCICHFVKWHIHQVVLTVVHISFDILIICIFSNEELIYYSCGWRYLIYLNIIFEHCSCVCQGELGKNIDRSGMRTTLMTSQGSDRVTSIFKCNSSNAIKSLSLLKMA